MVAGGYLARHRALEPEGGVLQEDRAILCCLPGDVLEPLDMLSRESPSDRPVIVARAAAPSRGACRGPRPCVEEGCAMQTETRGGSSETEVNELAASPAGCPSTIPQTAVTPDGKSPKACRSTSAVRLGFSEHVI